MNKTIRLLCMVLALLMVTSVFAACGNTGDEDTSTKETNVNTEAATDPVDSALNELRAEVDWGGNDFGILYVNEFGYTEEVEAEPESNDETGSGVINDIGKILSNVSGRKYIIVGTAPSMDGYASATSSMSMDGLKTSLNSRCADVIIGDTDILKNAPMKMLRSGLGDMLAKYISICEWRISNLLNGEYYCEEIARLIRGAVKQCVDNATALLKREPGAVQAVFEGLIIGGVAMHYAGLSRPASGVEHYISHILDMRSVAFGTPADLHGIQCAVGTLESVKLYEKLIKLTPNREKATAYAAAFDYTAWAKQLEAFLGKGAKAMIALEEKEKKYDITAHGKRLNIITENWQKILEIIQEELPTAATLEQLLGQMEMPCSLEDLGIPTDERPITVKATKDIRDKYVLSRLAWDLGVLEELLT